MRPALVGNPPYIAVKDKTLNAAYRRLYSTCKGTYAMTVPFMERFFGLAKSVSEGHAAGWVGQITSNSFMKREFGTQLIEKFLIDKDLQLVVDTSGAFIPGHGTPTVIIVGRNQNPVEPTVRAVLGVRGEPGRPNDPSKGIVWTCIVEHVENPGWDDGWITVTDIERLRLSTHPWSLTGGGSADLTTRMNQFRETLGIRLKRAGMFGDSHAEDLFSCNLGDHSRLGVDASDLAKAVSGDTVRDWSIAVVGDVVLPPGPVLQPAPSILTLKALWAWKPSLWSRATFAEGTYRQAGRHWLGWHQISVKDRTAPHISFAKIVTHNHFAMANEPWIEKPSALRLELSESATADDYLELLGVLNSSMACFWLKQNSHDKGSQGVNEGVKTEAWERFYEFTGTTLRDYPLPSVLPLARGQELDRLAHKLSANAPAAVGSGQTPSGGALVRAHGVSEQVRGRMIAVQEELDWESYQLYGLIEEDLTCPGSDLPGLALGERSFEIALARAVQNGDEETAWFARHGSTPITETPEHWPAAYRELVQRRLDVIASNKNIRLLEKPEYKRRWLQEPWEKRQERAVRDWLLDRLEDKRFWFDGQGRPLPRSVGQFADDVARDADLVSVLALWEGRPDIPVTQSLVRLLADEAVPYLAAYRYKEPGLRKREAWEQTWALQRHEDAGEKLDKPIPVPPKYTSADFTKQSYWQHRGKLDVPKERFILYPGAGRDTDPTPLLGWAGWDHAQQSLALSLIIGAREADGWADKKLVPLVAGLAELQPWVEQWHAEVDPTYGVSLAAFCAEQLTSRAAQVGQTLDELAAWRPAAPTRGRKAKAL